MTEKFACPSCGHLKSHVVNARPMGAWYYRMRKCRACGVKYQTREIMFHPHPAQKPTISSRSS